MDLLAAPSLILWDKEPWRPDADGTREIRVENGAVWVQAPDGVSFVTLRWLGEIPLGSRVFGDAFERSYADLEWRGILPERVMPWYCAVYDGTTCEGFGVRTRPNALCFWQVDERGVTLTLDLRSGTRPARIREPLCAAELVHRVGQERPFVFLQEFCRAMADRPVFPPHPVYGSNSWYYCYAPSDPDLCEQDAALLEELTAGLDNPPYAVVDCGWSDSRTPDDPCPGTALADGSEAFGDMKELADRIRRHGVRPGLWLRPLCVSNGAAVPEEWVLRRVAPNGYPCLDPSRPEVLELIGKDVKKVTQDWGYELIKVDFSTYDLTGRFQNGGMLENFQGESPFADDTRTTAQIIKDFYAAIAGNAGDAVIIGCDCIGHLCCGYFHLQRVGDDTSGQVFERTRRMGVNTLAFRLCQHRAFFDIDADCIGQTEGMPWERNREWLDILACSGTPLFVSIHPDRITATQKEALRAAYARASRQEDRLEPLDFTDLRYPVRWLVNGEEKRYQWLDETGVTRFEI